MKAALWIAFFWIVGCTLIIGSDGVTVTTETGVDEIMPIK